MELADYARVLRKRWLQILVLGCAGLALAAAVTIIQRPVYQASAEVFVSSQTGDTTADVQQNNRYMLQRVKTYAHLATTEIVLRPVIDQLGLETTPEALGGNVAATAVSDTTIVTITTTYDDPVLSAKLANAIADSLTTVVADIEPAQGEAGASLVKLTVTQSATVPQRPVSPKVPLNLGLGLLTGLALGLGIAILRELLDTRIRTSRDVEAITSHPVVGSIVRDARARQRPLIVHEDPISPVAESFRALRTNLQFVEVDEDARSFVITSALPNEGKSTMAVNLALTLIDAGQTALVVDADLRRPSVASYMGIEGAVGLTDVLIGRVDLDDAVQPWGRGALHVLPAGQVPPNPSELLGSRAMGQLIQELGAQYDWVIYDAPPLLPVTDAVVLAKRVSGAVVSVAAGVTRRHQVESAVKLLEAVGAPVAGIVLSMTASEPGDGYGYGYGYLAEEQARTGVAPRRSAGPVAPSATKVQSEDYESSEVAATSRRTTDSQTELT